MKQKTFIAALALAAACPVFAQTGENAETTETVEYSSDKYKVETNRFWSNWFISVGAGPQMLFSDHDRQMKFGKRISPALDIAIGKWFTPGIGVRFMYSGLSLDGATQNGAHSDGTPISGKPWNGYWLTNQDINFYHFHFDAMFNFSNLFCGYNEKRIWNCIPYGGLGVIKATDSPTHTDIAANFGILNTFRLSSAWDINLDIRGTIMSDDFDGEVGKRGGEGLLAATVGFTYKIKPRGWERSKTITRTAYNNDELNAMREKLNRMNDENARLREQLAEKPETVTKQIASSNLITFRIGKSDLSNEARVNLGMLAEVIKKGDPSTVYTITGYADAGTGSKKLNERLSKARAEAVYNCLVEEFGVNKSQLKVDYKGGVENMFYDDPRMSRAVITKSN